MGAIATREARGLFTKMLVDVYKERTTPTSFLRSFFPTVETATKYVSIEVQRGTERIAVDVERGTEGSRNVFSRSTEKIFVPPYYREYFDITELDLYDSLFNSESINAGIFSAFLDSVADKMRLMQDKIERAYELQCSQVLETGIIQLAADTNINFNRKAGSLVDKSGTPWSGAVDPFADIEAGASFIRQVGKGEGGNINAIFGSAALSAFLNNTKVTTRQDIRNVALDSIRMPQRNSVGGTLHGEFSSGSYNIRIWSYPEFYDNVAGVSTPYMNPKKVVLIPEAPRFKLSFAAVPQLITDGSPIKKGAFIFGDYIDQRDSKHIFDVKSAGVAIPVAIDQIYTVQVLA